MVATFLLQMALSVLLPVRCALCHGDGEEVEDDRRPRVPGLRPWDRPHLCRGCFATLRVAPAWRDLNATVRHPAAPLFACAPFRTQAGVVKLLGGLKYHGLRGLAWPLSRLMRAVLPVATAATGDVAAVTAVPLHRSRQRERGFNQSELLGRLLGADAGIPYLSGIVRRVRRTAQQARIDSSSDLRARNVNGAFRACAPTDAQSPELGLVDDLITSGATILAVRAALEAAGWKVRWALAVGLAMPGADPETTLDSEVARFYDDSRI
jgi:predicted amidophosphoribosyltransferase